ncbi:MAG: hypothetical protein LDLANPLL_02730 [Turneriella sp.]|nr:hypothetical protein [Turneriella sp.]
MATNRVQRLFHYLDEKFVEVEKTFLHAESSRHNLGSSYTSLLRSVRKAKALFVKHPRAALLRRLTLMETVLLDLMQKWEAERRGFNSLGFLLSRLRSNLANEILEPKLYQKIRATLEEEESFKALREKYPDAEGVITQPRPALDVKKKESTKIRLMLLAASNLHYALVVKKIVKKTLTNSPVAVKLIETGFSEYKLPVDGKVSAAYSYAIFFIDFKGQKRFVYSDAYFTPIEISQSMLKKKVVFASQKVGKKMEYRPYVQFYGRHFFVYGARLSYTIRPGGRNRTLTP